MGRDLVAWAATVVAVQAGLKGARKLNWSRDGGNWVDSQEAGPNVNHDKPLLGFVLGRRG
jgi:hypothetical protein